MTECTDERALSLVCQANALLELQVNATASRIDRNAALCGGNADDYTGLI
jgi:hypothetical protein